MPENQKPLTIYLCPMCGNPLPEGRSDRVFDSDVCRVRHHRWIQGQERASRDAKRAIDKLLSYAVVEETKDTALLRALALFRYIEEQCDKLGYNVLANL